jgi:HTH-type transcriptional regulator/antitoxin HipB
MDYPVRTLSQLRPILQGFRKAAGLTQATMASRLGVTQQTYAQLEANPATASVERLFRVLRALNVDLTLAAAPPPQSTDAVEPVAIIRTAKTVVAGSASPAKKPPQRSSQQPPAQTAARTGKQQPAPATPSRARSTAKQATAANTANAATTAPATKTAAARKSRSNTARKSAGVGRKTENW